MRQPNSILVRLFFVSFLLALFCLCGCQDWGSKEKTPAGNARMEGDSQDTDSPEKRIDQKDQNERKTQPGAELSKAVPLAKDIEMFVRAVEKDLNQKSIRFLFEHLQVDAPIKMTLGDESMDMNSKQWFSRSMTGLQMVKQYKFEVANHSYTLRGNAVDLKMNVLEQYDREGKTVKGYSLYTLDMAFTGTTFSISSMTIESSGLAVE